MIWRSGGEIAGLIPTDCDQAAVETTCPGTASIGWSGLPELTDINTEEIWTVCGRVAEDDPALNITVKLSDPFFAQGIEDNVAGT
jgi:hypothetical protein